MNKKSKRLRLILVLSGILFIIASIVYFSLNAGSQKPGSAIPFIAFFGCGLILFILAYILPKTKNDSRKKLKTSCIGSFGVAIVSGAIWMIMPYDYKCVDFGSVFNAFVLLTFAPLMLFGIVSLIVLIATRGKVKNTQSVEV